MGAMEKFLASRLYSTGDKARGGTRPAVAIATIGIAVGLLVMIVTIAVSQGFHHQIREKVTGFTQHIQVTNYITSSGQQANPVICDSLLLENLEKSEWVGHAQRYAEKAGMIRTDSAFQGFMLKGVGQEYDLSFYQQYLVDGIVPEVSDTAASGAMMLSRTLSQRLGLKVGDKVDIYFISDRVRARRLELVGIFQTNFSEYDNMYGMTDLYTLQRLEGWTKDQCLGVEVRAAKEKYVDNAYLDVRAVMDDAAEAVGDRYMVRTMDQINAGLFMWLDVLNVNVWVILALMLGIAGFTMISGLLIIILERTRTIGVLKALGSNNMSVRKVFLYLAARIVGRGMLAGNIIGIGLCLLQQKTGLIPLDPVNYYLDSVPMELGIWWLVALNVAMFLLSMLMLIGPSALIARIYPSESMRFE